MRTLSITILAAAVVLSVTAVGKDYGSLVYVAAFDSSAADKGRADVVCDGTNAAEPKKLGRALGVETVVVTEE